MRILSYSRRENLGLEVVGLGRAIEIIVRKVQGNGQDQEVDFELVEKGRKRRIHLAVSTQYTWICDSVGLRVKEKREHRGRQAYLELNVSEKTYIFSRDYRIEDKSLSEV
jgi:hypothetical protein